MRRVRVYLEVALSVVSLGALALTLVWAEWIEAIFGVEPDGGDGSAERLVVLAFAAVAVVSTVAARIEIRRLAAAARA